MIYQIYRNIKNQKLYQHIGTAKDSTNSREGKLVIIYKSLEEDSVIYARDKDEFDDKFVELLAWKGLLVPMME